MLGWAFNATGLFNSSFIFYLLNDSATVSKIVAISGPAAVGKTTICDRLIKDFSSNLSRLITATTRPPRPGEFDGIDYLLKYKGLSSKLSEGSFLEHEIIHGNMYGILKESILDAQSKAINLLLNIDVNGASSLRTFALKALFLRVN